MSAVIASFGGEEKSLGRLILDLIDVE